MVIARRPGTGRISAAPALRRARRVIIFPVFENYGEMILEWLSALGDAEPGSAIVPRVATAIERAIGRIERVPGSARHRNLATFLRHAALALKSSEWDGARYILMTAFATLAAGAIPYGAPLEDPARSHRSRPVLQFPELTRDTGIATG